MTSSLAAVEYGVLRAEPRLRPLDHVVELLVQCIDVSPSFSLAAAAARGSTSLLKHVARRLQNDSSTYDHDLFSHWVAQAMEQALRRDDLKMIQAIHDVHPESLDIRSLRMAIQFGTLKTVQWLVENRCDRQCCAPGVANLCASCVLPIQAERDAFEIVRWLIEEQVIRLGSGHTLVSTRLDRVIQTNVELVRWLHEHELLSVQDRHQLLMCTNGSSTGNVSVDVVDYLVNLPDSAFSEHDLAALLLRVSVDPRFEQLVEVILSSPMCASLRGNVVLAPYRASRQRVLQWDAAFMNANSMIAVYLQQSAGVYGHLGLLQWLWYEQNLRCSNVGCDGLDNEEDIRCLLEWAHKVHLDMWYFVNALARRGFAQLVEWTHHRKLHNGVSSLIDKAARFGHLNVVQWLHSTQTRDMCTTNAMDGAAENGHLHVVEWLHHNRQEGCTTQAMDHAAANNHLDVVQWLHANRTEGCTPEALRQAVQNGYVEIVQFLVSNGLTPCTTLSLCVAAVHGQVEILAWLFERRDQSTTAATLLCEVTRSPSRYIRESRRHELAARDTIRWLNARYSQSQPCHSCPCRFANYRKDIWVWAALVGDKPLLDAIDMVDTYRDPVLPDAGEKWRRRDAIYVSCHAFSNFAK